MKIIVHEYFYMDIYWAFISDANNIVGHAILSMIRK